MKKTVLVTGAAGYIGSSLVYKLLNSGYYVRGLDAMLFGGESLLPAMQCQRFELVKGDVRNKADIQASIQDIWGVVHLAAIVGDPACSLQPDLAADINWTASKNLFDLCRETKGAKRFVFASTCSNYGKMADQSFVDEMSPLNPVSLYAELKVRFEKYLLSSSVRDSLVPTVLRFATVYGLSPRMRFDLTVNEFLRDAYFKKNLEIFGEQFWRPYCHVSDIVSSIILVLESGIEAIDHQIFNVGDTHENYQKKTIADEILKILPQTKIHYVQRKEDPRDYRVKFEKIKDELGFKITKTVPMGLCEILQALDQRIIADAYSSLHKNN